MPIFYLFGTSFADFLCSKLPTVPEETTVVQPSPPPYQPPASSPLKVTTSVLPMVSQSSAYSTQFTQETASMWYMPPPATYEPPPPLTSPAHQYSVPPVPPPQPPGPVPRSSRGKKEDVLAPHKVGLAKFRYFVLLTIHSP